MKCLYSSNISFEKRVKNIFYFISLFVSDIKRNYKRVF